MVVLKPLDDAMRDGDPIRAVIANTGVNQDGKTQGITQPNGQAQEALIRDVYRGAGLDTQDCGFVEMHGTGTKVGDPIESHAVYQALAQGRLERDPLFIGSVKSNVGHLEGASGVVSVIKAAMMLEKDLILPNADFRTPNKKIPFEQWNMKVGEPHFPSRESDSRADRFIAGDTAHSPLAEGEEIRERVQLWLWRYQCACSAPKGPSSYYEARGGRARDGGSQAEIGSHLGQQHGSPKDSHQGPGSVL